MSNYNNDELKNDLKILKESKVVKRNILIDNFNEIDSALNNGASLEEVLEIIKKRTGLTIHQRYAYLVLQKHREGQTKTVRPNTQTVTVKPSLVEQNNTPIKQAAPAPVEVRAEQPTTQETKKGTPDSLSHYMSLPYDELPAMIKERAKVEISGVVYDVRSPEPNYETFGSSMDEFHFAGKMKELGHERSSQEYKDALKEMMGKKGMRSQYIDAHREFKKSIKKYENPSLPPTTSI